MIIRVNMTTKGIKKEQHPEKYELLGGRGLTSRIIFDEVYPMCNPLGPNNKLVIAPGLLGGTLAPSSGRISIGAKSPLTGGIKESNGGGTAGSRLAKQGIRALIIEGQPEDENLYILKINKKKAEILPCNELKGLGNYATVQYLQNKYGKKSSIISIGPAGERGYSMASVAITDLEGHPARHCGRGGMGAVLGSKKIKALVLEESKGVQTPYQDKETFANVAKEWSKELVTTKKVMTELGTANLVKPINSLGCLPTRNFSSGSFDGAEKLSGENLKAIIEERGGNPSHACQPGCVIRCSNVFKNDKGEHVTSGLEYETIGLLGPNCGIDDYDTIAQLDGFCDDFGIDTMELGVTIGVVMEAGLIPFGHRGKMFNLLDELTNNTILGKLIGQGATITGKVLGVKRIPAVKGQALSSYDPRGLQGTGVTYATTPMGGDHTAGNCLPGRVGFREKTQNIEYLHSTQGILDLSKEIQLMTTVCDFTGLCFFVGTTRENMDKICILLNAKYGVNLSFEELIKMSGELLKLEIEFNERAGISKQNNDLPDFFRTEKLSPNETVFEVPKEKLISLF